MRWLGGGGAGIYIYVIYVLYIYVIYVYVYIYVAYAQRETPAMNDSPFSAGRKGGPDPKGPGLRR